MNPHDSIHHRLAEPVGPPRSELRGRFLIAILAVGVAILAASLLGVFTLRGLSSDVEQIAADVNERARLVGRIRQEFLLMRIAEKNFIIEESREGMSDYGERLRANESRIFEFIDSLEKEADPELRIRLQEFKNGFEDFRAKQLEIEKLSQEHSLSLAAERSRTQGRAIFQNARAIMIGFIERTRDRIADAAGDPSRENEITEMTERTAIARECLESLHDLQYFEQAMLIVFSQDERARLGSRIEEREAALAALAASLAKSQFEPDRVDAARFVDVLAQWTANNRAVRELAERDTKAQAMKLSTTVVRNAYLAASSILDAILEANDQTIQTIQASHSRNVSLSRGTLFGTAILGVGVIILAAWIVVSQIIREYRSAAEVLFRNE